MGVRVVSDQIGRCIPLFLHVDKDVDSRPDWAGCCWIKYEMGYRFTSDHVIMVAQGEDNLYDLL